MKKQPEEIFESYMLGKIPPQALGLEEAVIGACLVQEKATALVIEILTPEHFYLPANKYIFEAITQLFRKSQPIDILTVGEKLKLNGKLDEVGGYYTLSAITNKIASGANAEEHAYIICQKFIAREIIKNASEAIKDAYTDTIDVLEMLDDVSIKLLNLRGNTIKNKPSHIETVANENLKEIKLKSKSDNKQLGISTGLKELDNILGGLLPQLYIVAGRPGSGKSSFVTSLINNIAIENLQSVALFSLEMTKEQVELRIKTIRTSIPNIRLLKGEIHENEWEKLHKETEVISGSPIFIDDSSSLNIIDLRSKLINLKSKYDIKAVFVDYIQRMTSAEKNQRDVRLLTNEVSSGLARLSKELKIPIVALAQLSREVERTKDKMPELHHLKESGNIEEDAYSVMFIYRPEYHGLPTFSDGNEHISSENKVQIIVAKHRNGGLGAPIFKFEKEKMYFRNLDDYISTQFPTKKIEIKVKESDFTDF